MYSSINCGRNTIWYLLNSKARKSLSVKQKSKNMLSMPLHVNYLGYIHNLAHLYAHLVIL